MGETLWSYCSIKYKGLLPSVQNRVRFASAFWVEKSDYAGFFEGLCSSNFDTDIYTSGRPIHLKTSSYCTLSVLGFWNLKIFLIRAQRSARAGFAPTFPCSDVHSQSYLTCCILLQYLHVNECTSRPNFLNIATVATTLEEIVVRVATLLMTCSWDASLHTACSSYASSIVLWGALKTG